MTRHSTKDRCMKKWALPLGEIHIIENRCKGCGFCIRFCPKNVLAEGEHYNEKGYHPPVVKDADACIYCETCMHICPDFAISVAKSKKEEHAQRDDSRKEDVRKEEGQNGEKIETGGEQS